MDLSTVQQAYSRLQKLRILVDQQERQLQSAVSLFLQERIGRPSVWGNPFSHLPNTLAKYRVSNREEAINRYREWFLAQEEMVARARLELRGKVLACWCKPAACHGDVLAEIAERLA